MYISPHGKAAGLSERLLKFADTFASDKCYTWLGLGLIDDLRAAAAIVEGKDPPPTLDEIEAAKQLEWDL